MTLAIRLAHDGNEQVGHGKTALDQLLALQQHEVFAIAGGRRIFPDFVLAVDFLIGHRHDGGVDGGVDLANDAPAIIRHARRRCRLAADVAFIRIFLTELVMADRLGGNPARHHGRASLGFRHGGGSSH
ncbi:hypothetical protein D3C80_1094320 [compost metagenome]